jgi:cathepsin A (carboxypeptidase C)
VYIPTLADELLQNAPEVPLKGVAAGDPCTDTPSQAQSMNMLWYAHKHGFVPDQDYTFLTDTCK